MEESHIYVNLFLWMIPRIYICYGPNQPRFDTNIEKYETTQSLGAQASILIRAVSFKHTSVITDHWSGRSYCGWISSLLARSHQTTFPKRLANIFVHLFYTILFAHFSGEELSFVKEESEVKRFICSKKDYFAHFLAHSIPRRSFVREAFEKIGQFINPVVAVTKNWTTIGYWSVFYVLCTA